MKKAILCFVLLALLISSVPAAFADPSGISGPITISEIREASQRTSDKSRQALVTIYGEVVNDPLAHAGEGGDTVLASVFQVANGALLVIGAFFACYVLFRKLTQTAHDGSVYDREKHTLWGPIRLLWGLVALVPTANGWALSQLMMLWGASLMGVGVANLGVDAAVKAFDEGRSMVLQPVMPSTIQLAHSLFESNLCMHGINASLAQGEASGALINAKGYVQQVPTTNGFILRNASFVCGGADISQDFEPVKSSTKFFADTIDTTQIRQAHIGALQAMQTTLNSAALSFVNAVVQKQSDGGSLPNVETTIQAAARSYENTISKVAETKQGDLEQLSKSISASIKEGGWITLGAWYQTFAQANTKMSDAVAAKGAMYGMSIEGDPGMFAVFSSSMAAYKSQQATTAYTPPLGNATVVAATSSDYSKGAVSTDSNKFIASIFESPGQGLVNTIVDWNNDASGRGQLNPLIKMKNIGDMTLITAEVGLGAYAVAHGLIAMKDGVSLPGLLSKLDISGATDVLVGVIKALSPVILMVLFALFVLGATMSTYLPMAPFVVWFGAAVNWLVIVGEAIIAAPLWAITHLGDAGDGLGNRTAHGYIFLLNVMIRPILMVVGFFLGGAALVAGGTLLNMLFGTALANVQFDSLTGVVSVIFFLAIYLSMCLNLIHSCFNLIFLVPDQVINWVGGHASSSLGRDDNDKLRHAVGVFSHRVEQMLGRGGSGSNTAAQGTKSASGGQTANGIKS